MSVSTGNHSKMGVLQSIRLGEPMNENMDMESTFSNNRAYIGKPTCVLTEGEMCADKHALE